MHMRTCQNAPPERIPHCTGAPAALHRAVRCGRGVIAGLGRAAALALLPSSPAASPPLLGARRAIQKVQTTFGEAHRGAVFRGRQGGVGGGRGGGVAYPD